MRNAVQRSIASNARVVTGVRHAARHSMIFRHSPRSAAHTSSGSSPSSSSATVLPHRCIRWSLDPQSWADLALYLNNLPPPTGADTGDGKYLSLGEASYEQFCRRCHEEDGRGDDDGFVPSLRNQHYRYLIKEMRNLAAGHRFNVHDDLARFMSSLKADEMQGLADYLSRMQGPVRERAHEK